MTANILHHNQFDVKQNWQNNLKNKKTAWDTYCKAVSYKVKTTRRPGGLDLFQIENPLDSPALSW